MNIPTNGAHPSIPAGFRIVEISREPIELYKILKFEGMADSGGQARAAVAAGRVLVNGAIETQKRKKIVSGDTIEFNGDKLFIQFCESTT
jgi:ribosome-associated protein